MVTPFPEKLNTVTRTGTVLHLGQRDARCEQSIMSTPPPSSQCHVARGTIRGLRKSDVSASIYKIPPDDGRKKNVIIARRKTYGVHLRTYTQRTYIHTCISVDTHTITHTHARTWSPRASATRRCTRRGAAPTAPASWPASAWPARATAHTGANEDHARAYTAHKHTFTLIHDVLRI